MTALDTQPRLASTEARQSKATEFRQSDGALKIPTQQSNGCWINVLVACVFGDPMIYLDFSNAHLKARPFVFSPH